MTFVDTAAWFALYISDDPNHRVACQWVLTNRSELVTTDYVIDETLTLLRSRGQRVVAIAFGAELFGGEVATIFHVTAEDVDNSWQVFHGFDDKNWSFTDCTCKVVMERLSIDTAFTFDHHFRQFGNVTVVP